MAKVLHVTECYSAGVRHAIDSIVAATPDLDHHLLHAGSHQAVDAGFTTARELPDGLVNRVRAVSSAAKDVDADVIHAHSSWAGVYCRVRRMTGRVVYQPHGYRLNDPHLRTLEKRLIFTAEALLARHGDVTAVLSEQELGIATALAPGKPAYFVPNVSFLEPPTLERAGGPERVVMSGRICSQKDPAFFAEVSRLLRRTHPSVRCDWLGGGDEPALLGVLRDGDVHVSGWLEQEEVATRLAGASVYLHTARYEGFPLSVLDAARCRVPVIVRDIPAFDGTRLDKVKTPAAAVSSILSILAERRCGTDRAAREAELLERMSVENLRTAVLDCYDQALGSLT